MNLTEPTVNTILMKHYENILDKNPKFSLRAYAKKLDVSPSMLSEVINGRKRISLSMANKISQSLNFSKKEDEYFRLIAEKETCKSIERKSEIEEKILTLTKSKNLSIDLNVDSFSLIKESYHFAILELLTLKNLKFDINELSRKLDITPIQFKLGLERLKRLGLIAFKDGRPYKIKNVSLNVSSEERNRALQHYHDSMLDKTKDFLKEQQPSERYVGSETLVIDEDHIEEAKEIFEECFDKLIALSAKAKNPKNVYYAGIQFVSVSKGDKK